MVVVLSLSMVVVVVVVVSSCSSTKVSNSLKEFCLLTRVRVPADRIVVYRSATALGRTGPQTKKRTSREPARRSYPPGVASTRNAR